MLATITAPQKTVPQDIPVIPEIAKPTHIKLDLSMTSCHVCPCCSSILLRHISRSRVYWRCSHCRALMSV